LRFFPSRLDLSAGGCHSAIPWLSSGSLELAARLAGGLTALALFAGGSALARRVGVLVLVRPVWLFGTGLLFAVATGLRGLVFSTTRSALALSAACAATSLLLFGPGWRPAASLAV